tara:strand:- start:2522 stop:3553 length:1032 start_codon:yes stop_codon:yes gene_type:complete
MAFFYTATRPADFMKWNSVTNLTEGLYAGTSTNYLDPNYVTHSMSNAGSYQDANIIHGATVGDSLWIHHNVTCITTTITSFRNNIDGYIWDARDVSGNLVARLDLIDNLFYLNVYGETSNSINVSDLNTFRTAPNGTTLILDIRIDVDGLDTTATIWNNNTLLTSVSTPNVVPTVGKPTYTQFTLSDTNSDSRYSVSEIIISDEETRGMRLAEFPISTSGNYTDWTGNVTDLFDNEDATYVISDTPGEKISGTIPAFLGATVDYEVKAVSISSRAWKSLDSSVTDLKHFIRIGAVDYELAETHTTTTEEKRAYHSTSILNPATTTAWTFSDLVNLEAGIKIQS